MSFPHGPGFEKLLHRLLRVSASYHQFVARLHQVAVHDHFALDLGAQARVAWPDC